MKLSEADELAIRARVAMRGLGECIVLDPQHYRADGNILIYRDGLAIFLHRYLWKCYYGGLSPREYLLPRPDCEKGCQNPRHRFESARSRITEPKPRAKVSRATGRPSAPQLNAAKTKCPEGHDFTEENTYRWTDKKGHQHRKCVKCTLKRTRKRHAAARRARKEGSTP